MVTICSTVLTLPHLFAAMTVPDSAANMWGKVKTVLQMVTIIFYYFAMALAPADGVGVISFTTQVLCWAVAAVTALSGCIYLWQNRSCFMQAK